MHIYHSPLTRPPERLKPGMVVEHVWKPGVPLVIVSGPHDGLSDSLYVVRLPEGGEVRVKRKNLRIGGIP